MAEVVTREELYGNFFYEPDTGDFGRIDGQCVQSLSPQGYLIVGHKGNNYAVHRLVFLFMTGDWPVNIVDHINRHKTDNRWDNLRDVTHSVNSRNTGISIHNKTGITGVYWDKKQGKYRAQICLNNKTKYLGVFDSLEDARQVRLSAERANGFINNDNYASDSKA